MNWLAKTRRAVLARIETRARAKRLERFQARQLQHELEIYFDTLESTNERRSLQGEMQAQ